MHIPVVLKDGKERLVSKNELQYLLSTKRVMFFQRSGGWVVIGRNSDRLRSKTQSFQGNDRRLHTEFAKSHWKL